MASIPPQQQQSQRRHSPEQSFNHSQPPLSPVRARSATSEDSQTLFINSSPTTTQAKQEQAPRTPEPPRPNTDDDDDSIRKCWICFSDSTEDTPQTSPWRDPCPCALVAHEECLLDWIADTEAPKNTRHNRSIGAPKIECPQCKAEIRLARPRNYIVDAVRGIERMGARAITPGALTFLGASLYHSSMAWGMHSIYAIFGSEDGYRILRPLVLNSVRPPMDSYVGEASVRGVANQLLGLVVDHLVHWRLYVGLPLITPVLVLSRTKLADSILPVLPILFFATQAHAADDGLDFTHWPPSASMCFAVLPYIRSAYNLYYERVWAEKERKWMREIQPRSGQQAGQEEDGDGGRGADGIVEDVVDDETDDGGENVFELRIDGGIWDEWEDGPAEAPPAPPTPQPRDDNEQAPPLEQPPLQADDDEQAPPPPNIANDRQDQPPAPRPQPRQQRPQQPNAIPGAAPGAAVGGNERRLSFSPTAIAETVLGAILFPTLAGLSGDLLKLLLPRAWTTPGAASPSHLGSLFGLSGGRSPAKGLLQEKWARSLVGGCLFVVAKDAVMLYVRWRMAGMHRERRVLDWDRGAKRFRS